MQAPDEPGRTPTLAVGGGFARVLLRLAVWTGWSATVLALSLGCAYLVLRHAIWPDIDRWRPQIERLLSQVVDAPVSIGELQSGFDGLRPSLRARAIRVGSGDDVPLTIEQASAVVSLRSLLTGSPSLVTLEVERPVIRVERLERRRFAIAGALVDFDRPGRSAELALVLASRAFSVRNARFDWRDRLGSEPMVIAGVDLHSASDGGHHHLSLRAPAIGQGVQQLEIAFDFKVAPGADPTDWRVWHGEAYGSAFQIQFAPLAQTLRGWLAPQGEPPLAVISGSGPLKTWARFEQGRLTEIFAKTFTESIEVSAGTGRAALRSLTLEVGAQPLNASRWIVTPRRLSAIDAGGFAFALDERSVQRIELDTSHMIARAGQLTWRGFDAARLLETARRLPWRNEWTAQLAQFSISGRISTAGLRWDLDEATYAVSLAFERLSVRRQPERPPRGGDSRMAPADQRPSFANLTGTAEFNDRSGRVQLESVNTVLRWPGVFNDPVLQLSSLRGELGWLLEDDPSSPVPRLAELRAQGLSFANADAAGEVTGVWRAGGRTGRGVVDMEGRLDRANAARVVRYLPAVVAAPVRAWVGRAIGAGVASGTRAQLRGDLADFPFRDPSLGVFRIETRVDQTVLAHTPGWPLIERVRGSLVFERAGMIFNGDGGDMLGVRIGPVQARIEDFAKPVLTLEGEANGATRQMLRVLEQSPLRNRLAEPIAHWQMEGATRLALSLEIALARGGAIDWRAVADVRDNRLRVDAALPWFESVNGRLLMDASGLRSQDPVAAGVLGGFSRWQINAPNAGPIQIDAHGDLDAGQMAALAGPAWREALEGQVEWRGSLRLDGMQWRGRFESDLRSMASRLPEPLRKARGEAWQLGIDWQRTGSGKAADTTTISVALRDDVRMVVSGATGGRSSVWRGALAVGGMPQMPAAGFAIDLRVPSLDADAWQSWLDKPAAPASSPSDASAAGSQPPAAGGIPIDRLTLIAPALAISGKTLSRVVLGASRTGGRWRANIHSGEVEGHFEWLPPKDGALDGAVLARLAMIRIPRGAQRDVEAMLDAGPKRLPALDVEAERLILSDRELGRLSLLAENAADGEHPTWRLQRLKVEHPGGTLDARGVWASAREGRRTTTLDFRLDVRDPPKMLETFGVRGALTGGGPASLAGEVSWRGSPLAIDYPSLAGRVDIQVGKGQFLKTEPGLGKLIGVLNLQSLPRRLSLDFRDVFAEGFAFDDIRGGAVIEAGVARTDNFRMRGIQAQVQIRGETNLADETQRLRVEVRPELNAGLASLAYAAMANPAIGLGSFVAQWALRKPLQDMFAYEYDVVGTWDDPNVTERAKPRFDAMAEELKRPVNPRSAPADGQLPPAAPR